MFPTSTRAPHDRFHSPPYPPYPYLNNHMDPHAHDFRAFYPYCPGEVKHRKRTSSAQLKVLESVFKSDTKPNAAMRKELAQQLEMTTRGVQVWFQNRRAKEKNKAQKAAVSSFSNTNAGSKTPVSPASPSSSSNSELRYSESPSTRGLKKDPSTPPALSLSPSSWPAEQYPTPRQASQFDGYASRRGSLPIDALHSPNEYTTTMEQSLPCLDQVDLDRRRFSMDNSLSRLETNPYAPYARSRNASSGHAVPLISRQHQRTFSLHNGRPQIIQRVSMPPSIDRRFSLDSRQLLASSTSPSPSPLSPYHPTGSLPDNTLYSNGPRSGPLHSLPGPLPAPGYSFGTPSSAPPSAGLEEHMDPMCSAGGQAYDTDEDPTSPYHYTRFGSITSIATSETGTSACYSDVGSYPEYDLSRRSSDASGLFSMMGELDMAPGNHFHRATPEQGFPTPSPTVSPSGSAHSHDGLSGNYHIGQSSELAFSMNHSQSMPDADNHNSGPSCSEPSSGSLFPGGYSMSLQAHASPLDLESRRCSLGHRADHAYPAQVAYPLNGVPYASSDLAYSSTDMPSFHSQGGEGDSLQTLLSMKSFTTPYGPGSDHSDSSLSSSVESFVTFPCP
ncbi:hypothetical protein BDV98DRAFT_62903 [Pterulicium gracile]|uniref:Homeobox domain-containing protein n=1 Tax=Pterulicium gracile TaxID=1884261 RepID=A0A5C3QHY7_9AGAR|nr:hypothetical protein BDV98DRAFT_62903 [Pterula gracilis]